MNFDEFSAKLQAERDFWSGRETETFDLVDPGPEYSGIAKMEKQSPYEGSQYTGEWVRSEHYRRDVERLEQRIRELEAK